MTCDPMHLRHPVAEEFSKRMWLLNILNEMTLNKITQLNETTQLNEMTQQLPFFAKENPQYTE